MSIPGGKRTLTTRLHAYLGRLARSRTWSPPSAEGGPGGRVTPPELRLAELVAQGLTNRDIAARLDMAERTIAVHVMHLKEKLGGRRRADIATWWVERHKERRIT